MLVKPIEDFEFGIDRSDMHKSRASLQETCETTSDIAWSLVNELRGEQQKTRIFENIFDKMSDSVMIQDTEGNILFVNQACMDITGYSFDELVGQNVKLLRGEEHDDAFYHEIEKVVLSGYVWEGMVTSVNKDGSKCTGHISVTAIQNGKLDRPYMFSIRRNENPWDSVTEERVIQKAL